MPVTHNDWMEPPYLETDSEAVWPHCLLTEPPPSSSLLATGRGKARRKYVWLIGLRAYLPPLTWENPNICNCRYLALMVLCDYYYISPTDYYYWLASTSVPALPLYIPCQVHFSCTNVVTNVLWGLIQTHLYALSLLYCPPVPLMGTMSQYSVQLAC